jgi:O-antigen ligase
MSIGGGGAESLEGTREWRLIWWDKIIDYTVHGKYFWTGKGFGINLTFDDGIELDPDNPSRNPHNSHLTILARSGVPGLLIWATLQLWFAYSMVRGWLRAKQARQHRRASLFAWVLAYWVAVLLNASFDPYLESPQGGIWFWCVFAYGIALVMTQSGARHAPHLVVVSQHNAPVLTAPGHA